MKRSEDSKIGSYAGNKEIMKELDKVIKEGKEGTNNSDGLREAREILKSEKGRQIIKPLFKNQSDPITFSHKYTPFPQSAGILSVNTRTFKYFPSLNKNFIQSKIEKGKQKMRINKIENLYI